MQPFDDILLLEPALGSEQTAARSGAEYVLKVMIMMVHQDHATQEWAMEMCGRAKHLVGKESLSAVSWRISDLAQPGILSAAVRSAARADVVVVAVSAAAEVPHDLHVWFDAWLPRRVRITSSLVALIGRPEASCQQASRILDYFRAVARKGGLDFFPAQRLLPMAPVRILERNPLSFVIHRHELEAGVENWGARFLTGSTNMQAQNQFKNNWNKSKERKHAETSNLVTGEWNCCTTMRDAAARPASHCLLRAKRQC